MRRRRASLTGPATLAGVIGALAAGEPVAFAGPAVVASGCETIDVANVERLLETELATVHTGAHQGALPEVQLVCVGDETRITVRDALTSKELTRTIRAPSTGPLQAQLLAFAISELFLASWLELVVLPHRSGEETAAAERRARAALEASAAASSAGWEIGAKGVLRARAPLGSSVHEQPLELQVGRRFLAWHALALAAVETARKQTAFGEVRVTGARAGVGLGWRPIVFGDFSFSAETTVSLLALRAEGVPASPRVTRGSASGVGASFAIAAGPALVFGRVRVGASIVVDLRVPSFSGRVPGDAPVVLGGLATGACVWSSYELAPF